MVWLLVLVALLRCGACWQQGMAAASSGAAATDDLDELGDDWVLKVKNHDSWHSCFNFCFKGLYRPSLYILKCLKNLSLNMCVDLAPYRMSCK